MTIVAGFDIETTGLDQEKGHRIIEFAAVLYELETKRKVGSYIKRVNPHRSIDPGAFAVHGISFEMLAECATWEEVGPSLAKILGHSNIIIAHNGHGFDIPFLVGELIRIGCKVPNVPCFDTMLEGRWATPMGKLPNLRELCFACGVEYDTEKAHAADYDVDVMIQCLFAGVRDGVFKLPSDVITSPKVTA